MSARIRTLLVGAVALGALAAPLAGLGDVPHEGGTATVLTGVPAEGAKTKRPAWAPAGFGPCKYEDSDGPCYWDASSAGNGVGQSFVIWPISKTRSMLVYVGGKGKAEKVERNY